MDKMSLGDSLRCARIQLGFSQERAAELCNVCEKTYGKLERGQGNVSLNVLEKVTGGLGLGLVYFIQGVRPEGHGAWEYFAVLEPCQVPDSSIKYTYGIMACENTPMGRYAIAIVHDVSTNADFVANLVEYFNSYLLSPIHLVDIIYDILP